MSSKKRNGFILAVLVLGVVAFAVAGSARPGKGGHGRGLERLERAISQLEVSGEVETSIYAILDEARAASRERRPEMREAHEQMRALMDAEAPDEEAILAQADRLGALKTQARKAQLSTRLRVQALLTPEQREALKQQRAHRRHGSRKEGR